MSTFTKLTIKSQTAVSAWPLVFAVTLAVLAWGTFPAAAGPNPSPVTTTPRIPAADWPRLRGSDITGRVPEGVAVPVSLPENIKPVWAVPVGEGFASPVVAGGSVYYLDVQNNRETAHRAEAATGKELWKVDLDAIHRDNWGRGPRCAPIVEGKYVYVQSARGEFRCLDIADGKTVWQKNFKNDFGAPYTGESGQAIGAARHGNAGSPIIDGPNIIVQVGSPSDASIVAFKKETGEVVWKSQKDQSGYACLIIAQLAGARQLVCFTTDGLMGLDPVDGQLLWRVPVKTNYGRHAVTPNIVGDVIITSTFQKGLFATRIVKEGQTFTPKEEWTNPQLKTNISSPIVLNDTLFGVADNREIYAVNVHTGKTAWTKSGLITYDPDKAHPAFLGMGKNILMLTEAGDLVMFAADAGAYKQISHVQQACGTTWSNLAYVDGRLFLRDMQNLLCLQLMP